MVGELTMGRFRVLERIGSGGMGTVYRGYDERLQRAVALKVLDGADSGRFRREAQAVARLNHPGIVILYELGFEAGRPLLVNELVEGRDLAALAREGGLSDRDLAVVGLDLCDALAHAHDRGVVHRDLKPQNIMVCSGPGPRRAKLMDFGIATINGAPGLTATGEVIGTLAYMSPEQAEGEEVSAPSDVYSLALTLFEAWAGQNPVIGRTPAETSRRIGTALPSLGQWRPDLPLELRDCVDSALDPGPELRPTLSELRDTLWSLAPELDASASVPAPGADGTPPLRETRGARLGAILLLAGALAALAFVGRPGLGLAVGLLVVPALLLASRLRHAAVPAAAPLLGALGVALAYPAVAGACGRLWERCSLGALGWCYLAVGSMATGLGPPLGVGHHPAAGWASSAGQAFHGLIVPLLSAESVAGALVFAGAAATFGLLLRARQLAVALLGGMVWSAALVGAVGLIAGGRLEAQPLVVAVAAVSAIAVRYGALRGLSRRSSGRVQAPAPV